MLEPLQYVLGGGSGAATYMLWQSARALIG